MSGTLVIRADASAEIGTGHVMRCLALGQAWEDAGGRVIFITGCVNPQLLRRLCEEGFEVHVLKQVHPNAEDLGATARFLAANSEAWAVLDGYHFDSQYQREVKQTGCRLLVIDDIAHLPHYWADIVLNQNILAEKLRYSCEPYTQLLLGTDYVLLRREFLTLGNWKRETPDVARRLLITLGGSDPRNASLKAVQALRCVRADSLEAVVVAGGDNPRYEQLRSTSRSVRWPIRVEGHIANMADLMTWADIAVAGGGSTCWELAFTQVPACIMVTAEHQRNVVTGLADEGVVRDLGSWSHIATETLATEISLLMRDSFQRARMASRGRELVDGQGVHRVLTAMMSPMSSSAPQWSSQ